MYYNLGKICIMVNILCFIGIDWIYEIINLGKENMTYQCKEMNPINVSQYLYACLPSMTLSPTGLVIFNV